MLLNIGLLLLIVLTVPSLGWLLVQQPGYAGVSAIVKRGSRCKVVVALTLAGHFAAAHGRAWSLSNAGQLDS